MIYKQGISPVIGIILLTAITVIIGVGTFQFLTQYSQDQLSQTQNNQILDDFNIRVIDSNSQESIIQTPFPQLNVTRVLLDGFECEGNIGVVSGRPLRINLSSCSQEITTNRPRLIIETEDGIIQRDLRSQDLRITPTSILSFTHPNCYNSTYVNTIGEWEGCNGMLIVNNTMLRGAASDCTEFFGCPEGDGTYQIEFNGNSYTFEEDDYNIFTGQVTDMSSLFRGTSLEPNTFNGSIGYWDTSNVENMGLMFAVATNFNQPLNSWDVSNVENMEGMFYNATSFNQPLNSWDVSNVENMDSMFADADSFNQPLNSWDVSNVENRNVL